MNVLILNSAHGKYPVGSEGWIQATVRAFRALANPEDTFICSTEPGSWDLTAYLAGALDVRIRLIVKGAANEGGRVEFTRLIGDFSLNPERTVPVFLGGNAGRFPVHPKDSWQTRDRLALTLADVVYPVSIRPGGRLDSMMREPEFRSGIRDDFRIFWTPHGFIPRYTLTGRAWNPLPQGEWLVHWTRASQGKWPGEKSSDFYRELFLKAASYVRSGADTLGRILHEGKIRGSSWKMPGGIAAVAFTALSPGEAISLMRWRKRFVRYSFEPYGVAIRKKYLVKMGAEAVAYTQRADIRPHTDFFQTHAAGDENRWAHEREWRLRGDFHMENVPPDSIRIIVPDESCARELNRVAAIRFPIHILFER